MPRCFVDEQTRISGFAELINGDKFPYLAIIWCLLIDGRWRPEIAYGALEQVRIARVCSEGNALVSNGASRGHGRMSVPSIY